MEQPTPAEVKVVFPTTKSDEDIQSFIDDATIVVSRCASVVAMDAATQKAIVKWVTAHMMVTTGELTSEKIGDAAKSYATSAGTDLRSTPYGQRALLLEPSGCLAKAGKQPAIFQVL